ncbi:uncharacterized protein LTR77_000600 [Saxophila tyrrhenica]|uniref:Major facilitator superfamily (MFS) profile domain-containing protein n=1 Tax=Saxophila tyrrhenica TaxID=1690608 RepID=A0AAV9PP10_9PEZI|nr:hypothetical protein LTR77_000600 [Saxophila tyrrhenica]
MFKDSRAAVEAEGVYIGGWSLKNAFVPKKHADLNKVEQVNSFIDWDEKEERRLVRKLDLRVLLPCCIFYFLAYLGKHAQLPLGFAAVLQADTPDSFRTSLHLHGIEFNWSISITYFMVTLLLIPSNLLLKKLSGKIYFPCVMVCFGAIVCAIAAVNNPAGLLTARFFLGIPESGVVPACIMYFSFWYKPSERALRIGLFHAANSLASAVGAFIAVGVDNLNGVHGLSSWRYLFIIEGAMAIGMAIPVYFLLLTFPENTTALNERERHIAINRFGRGATRYTDVTWDTRVFLEIFSRPSTYVFFVSYLCLLIVAVSLGTFLPIILNTFAGFSPSQSNVYTAAVYFVKIPCYWIWSWHADLTRERMWHYILPVMAAIPCYALWTHVGAQQSFGGVSPLSLYGVAFLGDLVSIAQPAALAYRSSTLYGAAEQAVGGASAIAALSISSIIGPQIYPEKDAPWYLPGFSAACATLAFTIIGFASLPLWFLWEAKRRKTKTGHAMPKRALEDALHAQLSEAAVEQEREFAAHEVKQPLDEGHHLENVQLDERQDKK